MNLFRTCTTLLFLTAFGVAAIGQSTFTNKTDLLADQTITSGVAIGIADMNGDGMDDIVRMGNGSQLSVEYQTVDGQPFENLFFGSVGGSSWAIVAGDINNDGLCDVMTGGSYNDVKVLTNAPATGSGFALEILPGPGIFVQGSNMADINNDGWLDVFACHDDGESAIWANDGAGGFTLANEWIDMTTTPQSDNSGNYGSIWTDFDNDRDLDLYIAKCRIGVTNQEDPRRINALFVNDGDNNYVDEADKFGLKIKYQSWTSDFGDIDNDGDLDCFITNHDHTLQLLENDGSGRFTDISAEAGMLAASEENYVQGIMRDFDNDGFIDLVTAQPTRYFHNNGDKTFTLSNPFGENFGTLAAGDLDHDGFVDLFVAYQQGFNNPSSTPDKLWMNDGNDNHFLCVTLQGTESNSAGVGARIEIHGSWGIQIREVRAGESYGITNSLSQTFGLGEETEIEYVVVHWPSGQTDVLPDVAADQFLTIVEGSSCVVGDFELELDGTNVLCPGEMVTISAPAGYDYLWSNGSVSESITVDAAGNFSAVIVDADGCAMVSQVVSVIENPDVPPTIEVFGDSEFCEGGNTVLVSSGADSYLWSNGETSDNIIVDETGDYTVTVPGFCSELTSEPFHVEVLAAADEPVADDVDIYDPQVVTLEATGGNVAWYENENDVEPVATGNTFETPEITETTTYWVEDAANYGGGIFATGMMEHQGSNYNGNNFNGRLIFDVEETFVLKRVTVSTDQPGIRRIEVWDANEEVLMFKDVDLPVGETEVALDFVLEPGTGYQLATNSDTNQSTLGTTSPRLLRSDEGVDYPYEVPGVVSIITANFGSGFYYYFFDWQIEVEPTKCYSDRVPVTVTLGPNAVAEVEPFGKLAVQPNPSNGQFTLDLNPIESGNAQLTITGLTGQQVFTEKLNVVENVRQLRPIDLSNVPSGVYFLKITSSERAGWLKLIVE